MNRENNEEMRPEYKMRGGVRAKFFAHAQRWAVITTADGALKVNPLSTGEPNAVAIVELQSASFHLDTRDGRSITPEVVSRSA